MVFCKETRFNEIFQKMNDISRYGWDWMILMVYKWDTDPSFFVRPSWRRYPHLYLEVFCRHNLKQKVGGWSVNLFVVYRKGISLPRQPHALMELDVLQFNGLWLAPASRLEQDFVIQTKPEIKKVALGWLQWQQGC